MWVGACNYDRGGVRRAGIFSPLRTCVHRVRLTEIGGKAVFVRPLEQRTLLYVVEEVRGGGRRR